jgi:hypothetical protein
MKEIARRSCAQRRAAPKYAPRCKKTNSGEAG